MQHRDIVKNAMHLDLVLVAAAKGFPGILDQDCVPTWHQVLWLGREVDCMPGLANKDMMDTIFNRMELGVAPTSEFHPKFLCWSSPHIAHLPVGKAKSFSGGDPTSLSSAGPGAPTRMPLSALPSAVSSHQSP